MKLLVTGSGGFIAGSIIAQAPSSWEISGLCRSLPARAPANLLSRQLDLTDTEKLSQYLLQTKPDVLIHTAAMTGIDFCEKNRLASLQANVTVTQNIADACKETGTRIIFCSTDAVFDGSRGNYNETDLPRAINVYAETKLAAEHLILDSSPDHTVARLALVTGLPVLGRGSSFLPELLDRLKRNEEIESPENEIRTPIDVITAGRALLEIAANRINGIIHLAGNTVVNRFEMIRQIALAFGHPPYLIQPVNSNARAGSPLRPENVSLDNGRARQVLKTPMLSLTEGIELSIQYNKTGQNGEYRAFDI